MGDPYLSQKISSFTDGGGLRVACGGTLDFAMFNLGDLVPFPDYALHRPFNAASQGYLAF